MQINLTHTSDTQVKLVVTPSSDELAALHTQVLQHYRSRVKVAGFRQGKAPLPLVEKQVDPNALQAEFLDEAVNQMYIQAVNEKQLRVVASPQVNLKKYVPFTELEFEAEVEVVGAVVLPDYKKIKKAMPAVKVTDKDVTEVIKQLQQRVAEKKDVDRAAKAGDQVFIDFKGTDAKGEAINGADGKDYPLTLGSDTFIPGFEDNLIGLKGGDEKTFSLQFPKDYGVKALAGKDVTFTVNVIKVQEVIEPKLDDAFAAQAGPFQTIEALKADIKQQVEAERTGEAERAYENELIEEIAKKTKVAIPKSLVDEQLDRIEADEKRNLLYRGQTWEEHLKDEGVTAEEHREQKRAGAEERVRASLALAEIADKEQIEVAPEELEMRMQALMAQYRDPQMQAELKKPEARREIASRLLTEKTIEKLKSYVQA